LFTFDHVNQIEHRIIAFNLMRDFFSLFGATGRFLPPMAVVGILFAWHTARHDGWTLHLPTLGIMAIESALLALPLLTICILMRHYMFQPYLAAFSAGPSWPGLVVLSLGAGIYEELVFRLMAFTALNILLIDLFKLKKTPACFWIVGLSAILFSAYHYMGPEPFSWHSLAFRTVAGLYFGVVFLFRGFGITAGCHAVYDLFIVGMMSHWLF
jgi:membrane protease YdiL (CAAX protease family)